MSKNVSALPLSGSVKTHYEYKTVQQNVVSILQHIPEINTLKGQSKLLEIVCQMVEDRIKSGNSKKPASLKIDKKQLVIDILDKVFSLNSVEKQILNKNIDYIFEHKNIIKINTRWRRFKAWVKSIFLDPNQSILELVQTPSTPPLLQSQSDGSAPLH